MHHSPLLSVCIPSYNRPEELGRLLLSMESEDLIDVEVLVVEDHAARSAEVEAVVRAFVGSHAQFPIRYVRNERNLGYDGNIRNCIELASGKFCMFMADDDLLVPGALSKVVAVLRARPEVGVVLRSWRSIDRDTGQHFMDHVYFETDRWFPAGPRSAVTMFRRASFVSGLVISRDSARMHATDRFDGTLLYQLYLVGNVVLDRPAYALREIVAICRRSDTPYHFFGSAAPEKARFSPNSRSRSQSLEFMRGMLAIASHLERTRGVSVRDAILRDMSSYSYPVLGYQATTRLNLLRFINELRRLGYGGPHFLVYSIGLLLLGKPAMDRLIAFAKARLGRTPALGGLYEGEPAT